MTVTPIAGLNTVVAVGGQAVQVIPPNAAGGFITNPGRPADQGITTAEPLYIDVVGPCGSLQAGGTIIALEPGETMQLIAGSFYGVYVNAATPGHRFTAVYWM